MCGIVGVVGAAPGVAREETLLRMRDVMEHRGPDGAGLWVDAERRVGLAHRRLAIIDLSEAGAQPMASEDGLVQLVFNGEIYNHRALRAELEAEGHVFRSASDTEAILRGYLAWGDAVVERLAGMFAFAIWDARVGRLFLARDRIGIKPLYFSEAGGAFVFASEIKALLEDERVPRELDPVAAWHHLSFLVPPAPLTSFKGVFKLPPGHLLTMQPGEAPRVERWWAPRATLAEHVDPAVYADDASCARELRRRLELSIERRMMSDVPFGVFLSGGLDSSTNVALMARLMDQPVRTFSVGFEDAPECNELEYARLVAREFRTAHHEVIVDEKDMLGFLPEMFRQLDEPLADWVCVPLHFVSKLARESGVTVVQVGEGSDEQFCGYEHFLSPLSTYRHYGRTLGPLPAPLRHAAAGMAGLLGLASPRWRSRARAIRRIARGEEIFWGGAICFRDDEKGPLWRGGAKVPLYPDFVPEFVSGYDTGEVVRGLHESFRAENPGASFYQEMLNLELAQRLPELLLMRVDRVAMASSIEARVPFLDHELVEFSMTLPMHQRLRGREGKWVLKQAMRDLLPAEIITRKKMGFGAPVARWLRGEFGRWAGARLAEDGTGLFAHEALAAMLDEHRRGAADHSVRLWVVLCLSLWHRTWVERREF